MSRSLNKLKNAGFTLVEVLVAFVILSVFLGVLYQTFSSGLRGSDNAQRYTTAVLYAESLLAEIGNVQPLEEGESEGGFSNGFRWKTSIRAFKTNNNPSIGSKKVTAFDIAVSVSWQSGAEVKYVTLQSIRLGREIE